MSASIFSMAGDAALFADPLSPSQLAPGLTRLLESGDLRKRSDCADSVDSVKIVFWLEYAVRCNQRIPSRASRQAMLTQRVARLEFHLREFKTRHGIQG